MEWESYFNEASAFCKVATGAMKKGTLGNLVIYNVMGIAVENFMTTLLMREGKIPEHSSISGMLRELKKIMPVPDEFSAEVRFMNSFMNFCALEVVPEKIPTDEETTRMLEFVKSLEAWAIECLSVESKTIN
jgi:HEPN domain-containing protein